LATHLTNQACFLSSATQLHYPKTLKGQQQRIGIDAPREVRIVRGELLEDA